MKTIKTFLAKKHKLKLEILNKVLDWKLLTSHYWPDATVNSLEHFWIDHLTHYKGSKVLSHQTWSVNIVIVGKKRMQSLNREHRNKNYTTDVLSFPSIAWEHAHQFPSSALEADYCLGDIVICKEVLIKQAKQFKLTIVEEYLHLLIHGFLHLLGYDHEVSQKEALIMEELEKKILDRISKAKV